MSWTGISAKGVPTSGHARYVNATKGCLCEYCEVLRARLRVVDRERRKTEGYKAKKDEYRRKVNSELTPEQRSLKNQKNRDYFQNLPAERLKEYANRAADRNVETKKKAIREGKPWTLQEDALVLEHWLTDVEMGFKLGRSSEAVKTRRQNLTADRPKWVVQKERHHAVAGAAVQNYKRWTMAEDSELLSSDLTYLELALKLNRTVDAVSTRSRMLRSRK